MNNDDMNQDDMSDRAMDRKEEDALEARINAWLDGDLPPAEVDALRAAADRDPALAKALKEAYALRELLEALPVERAPESLRRRLAEVPQSEQAVLPNTTRHAAEKRSRRLFGWLEPRWVMAAAAVPLVIAIGLYQGAGRNGAPGMTTDGPGSPGQAAQASPAPPTAAELEQARMELALAFAYLEKATRATEREIEYSIGTGMRDPVKRNTLRAIAEPFDLNEEQDI